MTVYTWLLRNYSSVLLCAAQHWAVLRLIQLEHQNSPNPYVYAFFSCYSLCTNCLVLIWVKLFVPDEIHIKGWLFSGKLQLSSKTSMSSLSVGMLSVKKEWLSRYSTCINCSFCPVRVLNCHPQLWYCSSPYGTWVSLYLFLFALGDSPLGALQQRSK